MPARTRTSEYRPGDNKWAASVLAISSERRQDQVGLPVHPERSLRLRRNLRAPDHQRQGERRGPQARGARRAQRLLLRARPHQRLVHRRQAICRRIELDARPRSQDRPPAQLRSQQRRPDLRRRAATARAPSPKAHTVPVDTSAARTGSRRAYNPELGLLYIPSIEGCNTIETRRAEGHGGPGRPVEVARALHRRRRQDGRSGSTAASRRSIP